MNFAPVSILFVEFLERRTAMAIVKNINGTSDNLPVGYASWRHFWESKMHRRFSYCSCISCSNLADVGGHVKKVYGSGEWYIVPICYRHNNLSSSYTYEVSDADLLRASV